jgi:hypothetical protein
MLVVVGIIMLELFWNLSLFHFSIQISQIGYEYINFNFNSWFEKWGVEIRPKVNQHLLMHHERWIVNGYYAVFYWIPIP